MVVRCSMCMSSFLPLSLSTVVGPLLSARAVLVLGTQQGEKDTELVGACAQGHVSTEPPNSVGHVKGTGATQTAWGSVARGRCVGKATLRVTEQQPTGLGVAYGLQPEAKQRVGTRSWRAFRSHAGLRGRR